MQLETAQKFVNASMGTDRELSLYEDYSGRGMRNRTTTAIVAGDITDIMPALIQVAYELGEDGEDMWDLISEMQSLQTDSLGRGIVIY